MKYFACKTAVTDRSFLYKGRRVTIKGGIVASDDPVVVEALEASKVYEEVEAPAKEAPAPVVDDAAKALLSGTTPAKDSKGNTTVGISTTGALDALKKNNK